MYCKECGTINYNKEEFCKNCGAPLAKPLAKKTNKNNVKNARKNLNGYDFEDESDIKSYSEMSNELDYSIKKTKRKFDNNLTNSVKNNNDYNNQDNYSRSNSNTHNKTKNNKGSQNHRRGNHNNNQRVNNNTSQTSNNNLRKTNKGSNNNHEDQYSYNNEYKGVITDNGYNYKSKNDKNSEIYNDEIDSYKSKEEVSYKSNEEISNKSKGKISNNSHDKIEETEPVIPEVKIREANFNINGVKKNIDDDGSGEGLLDDIPKQWIIIGVASVVIILVLFVAIWTGYRKNLAKNKYNQIIKQGVEYMNADDYNNAIEQFSLAITTDSEEEAAYIYLAQVYISQGMESEAISLLDQAYLSLGSQKIKVQLDKLRDFEASTGGAPATTIAQETEESSTDEDSEQKQFYQLGYNAYLNKNYDQAKNYFTKADGYEDSDEYLSKIQIILDNQSSEESSEKTTTQQVTTTQSATTKATEATTKATETTTLQSQTTTVAETTTKVNETTTSQFQTTTSQAQTTTSEQISSTAVSTGFTWSGDYIIPNSATTRLTENDLSKYTEEQLRYARNEIYARHGYIFNNQELLSYFETKSWYKPTISADSFNQASLTDIEKANVDLMNTVESKKK